MKLIDIGLTVTEQERTEMALIQTKIGCVQQYIQTPFISTNKEETDLVMKNALDLLGDYRYIEKLWWDEISKKYSLNGVHQLDYNSGIIRREEA
jgi:CXXX repeat modification system protein